MKVSDYIVEFFINKGITDVFGYPGGTVIYLMDSFERYKDKISAHLAYHEQGAAFAACGYAQASGKPGVAYATSGPGATNLISGICNAFFDSIPAVFITGQVDSSQAKGQFGVRQRGFQETEIVSIVKPVTKYAVYITDPEDVPAELEKAFRIAMEGRRGPVLLDIPLNIFRAEIDIAAPYAAEHFEETADRGAIKTSLSTALKEAKAPLFLIGAGVKSAFMEEKIRDAIVRLGIPAVSSMIAFDVMRNSSLFFGFIGECGTRTANFLTAKSDLIISIGSRMDVRQISESRAEFAPNARMIRFDIDEGEFDYRVHEDEIQIRADIKTIAEVLQDLEIRDYEPWIATCEKIRELLSGIDNNRIDDLIRKISRSIPDGTIITTDVGQNQVWIAQSFCAKPNQKVLFSGGFGAMGYSLPAAIGAYYGTEKKPVWCVTGDGGMQMNIQELQFVARENIPIKIIVLNNNALGMVRHVQENYYESKNFHSTAEGGYAVPAFAKIAEAYGIKSRQTECDFPETDTWSDEPELVEVIIPGNTYVTPKLEPGKPIQDQEPLIDRELYEKIMRL